MKKIFCLLIILMLLTCAAASAERHLEVKAVFSGTMEGKTIYFDVYEQNGKIYTISDLIPDCAVETDPALSGISPDALFTLLFLNPESAYYAAEKADAILYSWIEGLSSESKAGYFAGDLFENAGTVSVSSSSLSELNASLDAAAAEWNDGTENAAALSGLFNLALSKLKQLCPGADPLLHIKNYDSGKWIVIEISDGNDVIAVVSADRTGGKTERLLFSWREAGLYYFRDISMESSDVRASAFISLYSGSQSAYSAVSTGRPLFSETVTLYRDKKNVPCIDWTFMADVLKQPFTVSGTSSVNADGTGTMDLSACIEGVDKEKLNVSVRLDTADAGKVIGESRILHPDIAQENNEITLTASTQLMHLAVELMPALPEAYQNLILNYLLKQ